eukprot:COSAG02_NODE_454_length_22024_cov_9.538518_5_plen_91_part_00
MEEYEKMEKALKKREEKTGRWNTVTRGVAQPLDGGVGCARAPDLAVPAPGLGGWDVGGGGGGGRGAFHLEPGAAPSFGAAGCAVRLSELV